MKIQEKKSRPRPGGRMHGRVRGLAAAAGALFAFQACVGQLGDVPEGGEVGAKPSSCTATTLTTKPLRRLTNGELYNALVYVVGAEMVDGLELPTASTSHDGFESDHRALQVSELVVDKLSTLAFGISKRVLANPSAVLSCDTSQDSDAACLERLIDELGPRTFRRPLTSEQRSRYLALANELLFDEELPVAAALIVQALLQEPQFLYRLQRIDASQSDAKSDRFDDYTVAQRMAFLLWQGPADEELLSDAAAGRLQDPKVREAHVRRMFADPKAEQPLRDFARQWLGLDRLKGKYKDAERFPGFDAELAAAMSEQSQRFVASTLAASGGALRSLLTSSKVPMTAELAAVYGVAYSGSEPWKLVELPPAERAGILTQAALLSIGGHQLEGSPILRGVDVLSRFLCVEPAPPPPDIDTSVATSEDDDQIRTNRERFEEHVEAPVCNSCHQSFNPIGYALENFDAIGQFRSHDNGLPVDAEARLTLGGDLAGEVDGPIELSKHFASSAIVQRCIEEKMQRFQTARELDDGDRCRIEKHQASATEGGVGYLDILLRHVTSEDFVRRPKAGAEKSEP
jgi:hypothetical protein